MKGYCEQSVGYCNKENCVTVPKLGKKKCIISFGYASLQGLDTDASNILFPFTNI